MKSILRMIGAIIVLVLSIGIAAAEENNAQKAIKDVPVDHWAYKQVSELVYLDYMTGYPDGSFRPNNNMTKAEFMAVLANILRDKYPSGNKYPVQGEIISNSHWAYSSTAGVLQYISPEYVKYVYEGQFKPDEPITREEVVNIIAAAYIDNRAFNVIGMLDSAPSKDISDFKSTFGVELCYKNNLVSCYPDGTFRPKNKITRAEVCAILVKLAHWPVV